MRELGVIRQKRPRCCWLKHRDRRQPSLASAPPISARAETPIEMLNRSIPSLPSRLERRRGVRSQSPDGHGYLPPPGASHGSRAVVRRQMIARTCVGGREFRGRAALVPTRAEPGSRLRERPGLFSRSGDDPLRQQASGRTILRWIDGSVARLDQLIRILHEQRADSLRLAVGKPAVLLRDGNMAGYQRTPDDVRSWRCFGRSRRPRRRPALALRSRSVWLSRPSGGVQ